MREKVKEFERKCKTSKRKKKLFIEKTHRTIPQRSQAFKLGALVKLLVL